MTKKNEVAERSLNEKRFCKKCEYYYSEFFTCPICYGEKRAEERIIKLLWANTKTTTSPIDGVVIQSLRISPKDFEALIKGENK